MRPFILKQRERARALHIARTGDGGFLSSRSPIESLASFFLPSFVRFASTSSSTSLFLSLLPQPKTPGKHGHAKCHFVAIDIFTGKKYEELTPSSHNCDVPHVSRQDYTLLDVSEDGFLSLMDDSGNTKDDLALPKGTEDSEKLAEQIQKDFDEGKELVVSVLKSMGEEMVCAVKTVGGGGN